MKRTFLTECGNTAKKEEVEKIVAYLNEFYENHGRMPSNKELGKELTVIDEGLKDLTYEMLDGHND